MRLHIGLLTLAASGCAGGVIDIGPGECPFLSVDATSIDFAEAPIGERMVRDLLVTNYCEGGTAVLEATLSLVADPAMGWPGVDAQVSLEPGASQVVEVAFTAQNYLATHAELLITTNDPTQPTASVALAGLASDDQDGDGFKAFEAGGDDCNDFSDSTWPGAPEIWYDGEDQDCGHDSDYDQDGDGHEKEPWGGDCADLDPDRFPGNLEQQNGIDDDCDGVVDEDWLERGALIVSEIMPAPKAVFDTEGEWFEVYNTTSFAIDMMGFEFEDNRGDSFVVVGSLPIEPASYLVFGVSSDASKNGGVPVDYEYDRGEFALDDGSDNIRVWSGEKLLFSMSYSSAWSSGAGVAMNLDPQFLNADAAPYNDYWCSALDVLSAGDLGSPGAPNIYCTSVDHDGDGYSEDEGDCADDNAAISPGAVETWNDLDDDCDGTTDVAAIDDLAVGYVDGDSTDTIDFLGSGNVLSVIDLDEDGTNELFVGTGQAGWYSSTLWGLDASSVDTFAGPITDYEDVTLHVSGSSIYYDKWMVMSDTMGDNTGDGVLDLVVAGGSYYTSSGHVNAALFEGGSALSGTKTPSDADYTWSGLRTYFFSGVSDADLNGDGVAEVVFGDSYGSGSAVYGGAVHIVDVSELGSGSHDIEDADQTIEGDSNYGYLGWSASGSDLDDDGYDEVMACGIGLGGAYRGACYAIEGSSTLGDDGLATDLASFVIKGAAADYLGRARPVYGDFDDDGDLDVVVASDTRGAAYVFFDAGQMSGTYRTSEADTTITTNSGAPSFLGAMMDVGDIDGDGIDDLAIGAPDRNDINYVLADEEGSVFLYFGDSAGWSSTLTTSGAGFEIQGSDSQDMLGLGVLLRDLDGDGQVDLTLSAPGYDSGKGRVWFLVP